MNIPIHVFGTIDLACLHLGYQCNSITQSYDEVALVEAKAKDGRTKAAMEVLKNKEKYKDVRKLVRFKDSNIGVTDDIENYPSYLSFLL